MSFDPFCAEYRENPYETYARLRVDAPAYFSELLQGWVFTRYEDVNRALKDPLFGVDRQGTPLVRGAPLPEFREDVKELADAMARNMLLVDPPNHTRLRALASRGFTSKSLERYQALVKNIVARLLDDAASRRDIDWIGDFAYPLSITVIAEVLGVPPQDQAAFRRWAEDVGELLDPFVPRDAFERGQDSALEMYAYFKDVFAECRKRPRDDLVSALVLAEQRGDVLTELELFSNCVLLLGAGHKTTCNLLGNSVICMLKEPKLARALREKPELLSTAVEEFARFESPVQTTARIARADIPHHDALIRKGDFVLLVLGAANRDPAEFEAPDSVRLDRAPNRHLAFGAGIHACLGVSLARLEMREALSALLARFPRFEGNTPQIDWKPSVISRGVENLPLRL